MSDHKTISHHTTVAQRKSSEAHLVTLAPPSIRSLLSNKELTRPPRVFARLVRLADERERLKRELRRVCEADAPRAEPSALAALRLVQVFDGVRHRALDVGGTVVWVVLAEDRERGDDRRRALRVVELGHDVPCAT